MDTDNRDRSLFALYIVSIIFANMQTIFDLFSKSSASNKSLRSSEGRGCEN